MSRELAGLLFLALLVAEGLRRVAVMWEQIGRAACPFGDEL